jgi:hypothetical protein
VKEITPKQRFQYCKKKEVFELLDPDHLALIHNHDTGKVLTDSQTVPLNQGLVVYAAHTTRPLL